MHLVSSAQQSHEQASATYHDFAVHLCSFPWLSSNRAFSAHSSILLRAPSGTHTLVSDLSAHDSHQFESFIQPMALISRANLSHQTSVSFQSAYNSAKLTLHSATAFYQRAGLVHQNFGVLGHISIRDQSLSPRLSSNEPISSIESWCLRKLSQFESFLQPRSRFVIFGQVMKLAHPVSFIRPHASLRVFHLCQPGVAVDESKPVTLTHSFWPVTIACLNL